MTYTRASSLFALGCSLLLGACDSNTRPNVQVNDVVVITDATPNDATPSDAAMCMPGQTNCGGVCLDLFSDGSNCGLCGFRCPTAMSCVRGTCTGPAPSDASTPTDADASADADVPVLMCAAGMTQCGSACVVLNSDMFNCGACGNRCTPEQTCGGGTCVARAPADAGLPDVTMMVDGAVVCGSGFVECGGFCLNVQSDPGHCGSCTRACAAGQVCTAGNCVASTGCAAGLLECGGFCLNVQSDPGHCGSCTRACASGQVCTAGNCVGSTGCTGGLVECGGFCLNVQSDPGHCGTCSTVCGAGQVCTAGRCVTGSTMSPDAGVDAGSVVCGAGLSNCGGVCNNLQADPGHCGTCSTVCGAGQICSAGRCTTGGAGVDAGTDVGPVVCGTGLTNCSGACNNLQADPGHCGTCTTVCGAGQVCSAGRCTTGGVADAGPVTCGTGLTNCSGVCNNLQIDPGHCGACTTVCGAGQVCSAGRCTTGGGMVDAGPVTCGTGLTNCSGVCNDLRVDPSHCGTCTTMCGAGQVCSAGVCITGGGSTLDGGTCTAGYTNCSGECVSLLGDQGHCGTCTTMCSSAQTCASGRCVARCGDVGDPCCTAAGEMPCPTGIMCVSGMCMEPVGCGHISEPCCGGVLCGPMTTCVSGICR